MNKTHRVWVSELTIDIPVEEKQKIWEYRGSIVPLSSLGFQPARPTIAQVAKKENSLRVCVYCELMSIQKWE